MPPARARADHDGVVAVLGAWAHVGSHDRLRWAGVAGQDARGGRAVARHQGGRPGEPVASCAGGHDAPERPVAGAHALDRGHRARRAPRTGAGVQGRRRAPARSGSRSHPRPRRPCRPWAVRSFTWTLVTGPARASSSAMESAPPCTTQKMSICQSTSSGSVRVEQQVDGAHPRPVPGASPSRGCGSRSGRPAARAALPARLKSSATRRSASPSRSATGRAGTHHQALAERDGGLEGRLPASPHLLHGMVARRSREPDRVQPGLHLPRGHPVQARSSTSS